MSVTYYSASEHNSSQSSGYTTPNSESYSSTDTESSDSLIDHGDRSTISLDQVLTSSESSGLSTPNHSLSESEEEPENGIVRSFLPTSGTGVGTDNMLGSLSRAFKMNLNLSTNVEEVDSDLTEDSGDETDLEPPSDHRKDSSFFKNRQFDEKIYIKKTKGLPAMQKYLKNCVYRDTRFKLTNFLIDNESKLENKHNVYLLLSVAIECALGGRINFNKISRDNTEFLKVLVLFSDIMASRGLNVSMICTLGHFVIYNAWEMRNEPSKNIVKKYNLKYDVNRVISQIGGEHVWMTRYDGNISHIKRKILNGYQAKPLDKDFANMVMNFLGIDSQMK